MRQRSRPDAMGARYGGTRMLTESAGRHGGHRLGITLLEVLVVIAVIALLATLILPAVQAAREASRRATCTSHMRQLGQGIAGYEGVRGHYPIRDVKIGTGVVWSEFVELLPHVGEQNVYGNIDFDKGIDRQRGDPRGGNIPDHNPALLTKVTLLLCPSDTAEEGNNYRFCTGSLPSATGGDGAFRYRSPFGKPALVTDGESHTVAMSEKLVTPRGSGWSRLHNFWYSGYNDMMGYPYGGDNRIAPDEMIDVCKLTPAEPASWHPYSGQSWSQCWFGYVLYNHVAPPNTDVPDCTPWNANPNSWLDDTQQSPTEGMFTARSWHPGGVNVLFLDGHVRFMRDSVDLGVWRGMASIDGGERF